jgi:hypothetical protein
MTNQRILRRGLSVAWFLAAALSNCAALAQIPHVNLTTSGSSAPFGPVTVQVGTAVPLTAAQSPYDCPRTITIGGGACVRECVYYGGEVQLKEISPGSSLVGTAQFVGVKYFQCQDFSTSLQQIIPFNVNEQPATSRVYRAQLLNAGTIVAASGTIGVTWNKAPSSTSPVGLGPKSGFVLSDTPITLNATVTGFGPSGTVNFKHGSKIVASAPASISSGGQTAFQVTTVLNPGTYNLVAEYGGDQNNLTSSSPSALPLTVTISPTHAAALQTIIDSLLLDD